MRSVTGFGHPYAAGTVATLTALKAIDAGDRFDGLAKHVLADNSQWVFDSDGTGTGDDIFMATPAAGDGRWVRVDRRHTVATVAAVKAIPALCRYDGQDIIVSADGSRWKFSATSALTGDDLLVIAPTAGDGRWLRATGRAKLSMAVTKDTADAAVLLTLQAGQRLRIQDLYWTITADFTGGSSSAIGVSSNKSGFSTKGDLLGGATGNVAAALTAALSPAVGTVGTTLSTRAVFKATDTIRFDRITSAFTAGTGTVELICDVLDNAGA